MIKNIMNSIGRSNLANREKWLEEILRKIPKGLTILDAGAGELRYKKFCSHLNYVSQDFGEYNGNGDGFGMQTGEWDQTRIDILCDIINIPVMDNSYDAIMCIEVFEHLPDPVKAINEFSRILKPNGYLIITAPLSSLTHFAPFHFCNRIQ
ncbi:MAG: class I SAM-dependent methyltransferase [Saprospiraceae bacterium]|nr:class I SAM-dependent methyltransferase [Candidatus Brachybacter algidus]